MPIRMIRDWTDSERVAKLSAEAEVFLLRLMMKADDYGTFHANPSILRASLFPLQLDDKKENQVEGWLKECENAGLLTTFEAEGKKYLRINNFGQRMRNARSKFPNPPQPAASRGEAPPELNTNRNENTNTNGKALTFDMFKKVIVEDEIFLEALTMTHKGKDIEKAISESFAYLIADEKRARNSSNADIRQLVNTWLSNQNAEKPKTERVKLL